MTDEDRSNVVAADFRPHIVIVTKRKTYDLGPDAVGQPMSEVLGDACPADWRDLKRYMTKDGYVVARPEQVTEREKPDQGREATPATPMPPEKRLDWWRKLPDPPAPPKIQPDRTATADRSDFDRGPSRDR